MAVYIIDGNNLMGRKRSRLELLAMLADFARSKGIRVQVVFDGAPEPNYPEGSAYKGVKISYSQRGKDADSKIRKIIGKATNPEQLVIVTSDRSLATHVKLCSVRHMHSAEFLDLLAEAKEKQIAKKQQEKPPIKGELNEWLRYFGYKPNEANQDYQDTDEEI